MLSRCAHDVAVHMPVQPLGYPRAPSQVIFCTAARTTLTGDLSRVEEQGVANVIKSLEVTPEWPVSANHCASLCQSELWQDS